MATTTIKGKDFLLKLSPDNGTTKYTVVCLEAHKGRLTRNVKERNTQCGLLTSRDELKGVWTVNAVCNTTPAAVALGVGEASLELIRTWIVADTALILYRQMPVASGTDVYESCTVYLTALGDDSTVGEYLVFDFEITMDGELDITP